VPLRSPGRRAPAAGADLAVRLLLRHSDWWALLSNQDHEMLHDLGGTHGAVIAWLEQQITEHGDLTWAALDEAMQGLDWHAQVRQWVQGVDTEEEQSLGDLQRVVHRLWRTRLGDEVAALIAAGTTDREQLDRVRELRKRIDFHTQAERGIPPPPQQH
jgi:DNA primase